MTCSSRSSKLYATTLLDNSLSDGGTIDKARYKKYFVIRWTNIVLMVFLGLYYTGIIEEHGKLGTPICILFDTMHKMRNERNP